MSEDLESRLRDQFRSAALPPAPPTLEMKVDRMADGKEMRAERPGPIGRVVRALAPAAIVLVLGVTGISWIGPWLVGAGPGASVSVASPTVAPGDRHTIVLEDRTLWFGTIDGALVIRQTRDGTTTELARVIPGSQSSGTLAPVSAAALAMACSEPGSSDLRLYVFGQSPLLVGRQVTFFGGSGHGGTADGTFLYAFDPSVQVAEASVRLLLTDQPILGMGSEAFRDMATIGRAQPSGCLVVGE